MKTILVIGGMGSGKSTVVRALASLGIPAIDLDVVGHEVLTLEATKTELACAFGPEILDAHGEVIRGELAAVAFADERNAFILNGITHPRIERLLFEKLRKLEQDGQEFAVVECSAFEGKQSPIAALSDCIVAVTAPLELRIARAMAKGWSEADVRARIARQMSDDARIAVADVVFENAGSPEHLFDQVVSWLNDYKNQGTR